MHHINLMPWRESKRTYAKYCLWSCIGLGVGIAMIVFVVMYQTIYSHMKKQHGLNEDLQEKLSRYKHGIHQEKIRGEMQRVYADRIQRLDDIMVARPKAIHFLEILPTIMPDDLVLHHIAYQKKLVSLTGAVTTPSLVSIFMSSLLDYFPKSQPELLEMNHDGRMHVFKLALHVR